MKNKVRILFFGLMFVKCHFAFTQTNIYDTILHASLQRTYLLHIPPSYNSANSTPLIIGLHGGASNSWYSLEEMSKLIAKSNSSGFILVYPEGVKFLGMRTWNGGGCCGYAVSSNIDDVGFINALIDSLRSQYNIDTTRIYATGISNGAIMAYRLACELSHRIAAIAVVAGTLEDTHYTCIPLRPVPIIQFHSVLDSNIYMQGGVGQGISGYNFNPVNYGLQKFATFNNCVSVPDSNYYTAGNTFYYKKRWSNCSCNAKEILYVTGDGGHSWHGGQQGSYAGADPPSLIINANDSMWIFFQQHPLCNPTAVNNFQNITLFANIYPNPTSGIITLQLSDDKIKNADLKIFDLFGRSVFQKDINTKHETLNLNLPNGMYFYQIKNKQQIVAIGKIIIQ
ncbi:MAG: T9SS type A sorting domain-containing protein [Bacteroidota bacterium]